MICLTFNRTGTSTSIRTHTLNEVTTLDYSVSPNARFVLRLNVSVCGAFTLENVNVSVVVTITKLSV